MLIGSEVVAGDGALGRASRGFGSLSDLVTAVHITLHAETVIRHIPIGAKTSSQSAVPRRLAARAEPISTKEIAVVDLFIEGVDFSFGTITHALKRLAA